MALRSAPPTLDPLESTSYGPTTPEIQPKIYKIVWIPVKDGLITLTGDPAARQAALDKMADEMFPGIVSRTTGLP